VAFVREKSIGRLNLHFRGRCNSEPAVKVCDPLASS